MSLLTAEGKGGYPEHTDVQIHLFCGSSDFAGPKPRLIYSIGMQTVLELFFFLPSAATGRSVNSS